MDVHSGLLEDVEAGVDRTALRLGGARKRLDHLSRGARDNCRLRLSSANSLPGHERLTQLRRFRTHYRDPHNRAAYPYNHLSDIA